jgi:predicted nucleotidyltransferase
MREPLSRQTDTARIGEVRRMIADALVACAPRLAGHRVVLFGSRARGTAGPRSDFDLGVDGAEPLPLVDFFEVEDALESLPTLYRIDWVDLRRVSPEFRERALRHVETIYEPALDTL